MLSCAEREQWKMTCLSYLSPPPPPPPRFRGNKETLCIFQSQKRGALSVSKIASFILTFKNDVFSCLHGVPEALPTSWVRNQTHSPWPVHTSPHHIGGSFWGSFRGVSAPLSLGSHSYVILYSTCVLCTAFSMYGTLHNMVPKALLKTYKEE